MAQATEPPTKVSDKLELQLRKVQHEVDQAVIAEEGLTIEYNTLKGKFQQVDQAKAKAEAAKAEAVKQAFKEAGLSDKDYDLNTETYVFTKKATKPEKK